MGARVKGAVWCDKSPGSDCNRRGVNECAIVVDKNSFPESMRVNSDGPLEQGPGRSEWYITL